ncbi:MAG: DUF819 family protein [Bacteroidales bacterium]|jgi:uncharacterized membrane protein|nr:DUF819 family protein [Bacteroidales bacterium]
MILKIILVLFYLLAPAAVLYGCRRWRWMDKIGPILILYFLGAIIANLGIFPITGTPEGDSLLKFQNNFSTVLVPMAIPMILLSFTYRKGETKDQLIAMITGLLAVIIAVVAGYPIFAKHIPDAPKIAGMYTACLTGGTVNMAAVSKMLGVDGQQYALLNTYDMMVSFTYLVFIMAFGIRWARKLLPVKTLDVGSNDADEVRAQIERDRQKNPYAGIWSKEGLIEILKLLGVTLVVVGLSAGVAVGLSKLIPGTFMMWFILSATTFSIAASFIKPIRRIKYSYEVGMYLIYIFSIVVASMANVRAMDFSGALFIVGFLLFMEVVSLTLQLLSARLFKVDADTAVIASVTYINSPPFVPMIAASMNNKRVLAPGLAIGVIGYAVGNYLGVLICNILGTF